MSIFECLAQAIDAVESALGIDPGRMTSKPELILKSWYTLPDMCRSGLFHMSGNATYRELNESENREHCKMQI